MYATEMLAALAKVEPCEGLSEWIRTVLFERMQSTGHLHAIVKTSEIEWPQRRFTHEMEEFGYKVVYECDDRPCAVPYYVISIPSV